MQNPETIPAGAVRQATQKIADLLREAVVDPDLIAQLQEIQREPDMLRRAQRRLALMREVQQQALARKHEIDAQLGQFKRPDIEARLDAQAREQREVARRSLADLLEADAARAIAKAQCKIQASAAPARTRRRSWLKV